MNNYSIKNTILYNILNMFTERFYDSFKSSCNIYYKNILSSIENIYENKKTYKRTTNNNDTISEIFNDNYSFDNYCSFCLNPKNKDIFIKLECGHQMHYFCFKKFILNYNECPFCRENISIEKSVNEDSEVLHYTFNDLNINELYYK
jgi:hypothetical protein